MALRTEHPLHGRARTRNVGLGLVLIAFAALVFALTVVKVRNGDVMEGYDHQPRASMLPADPAPVAPNAAPVAAPGTPAAGMPGVAPAANGAAPEASR